MIDWADGEDPQRVAMMPLTARLIAQGEHLDAERIESLGAGRTFLRMDLPKGGAKQIRYDTSLRIGPHD